MSRTENTQTWEPKTPTQELGKENTNPGTGNTKTWEPETPREPKKTIWEKETPREGKTPIWELKTPNPLGDFDKMESLPTFSWVQPTDKEANKEEDSTAEQSEYKFNGWLRIRVQAKGCH